MEHGETRRERQLRQNRLKIALVIAVIEGFFVVVGVIPWWAAVLFALVGIASYLAFGRASEHAGLRSVTWIAAVSQLVVVLIPALVTVTLVLAVIALVLIAAVVLVALLFDRR